MMILQEPYRRILAGVTLALCISVSTFAQNNDTEPGWVDDDNPVAAMLDSLILKHYFECSNFTTDTNELNACSFASDSVPRYEPAEYMQRIALMNERSPIEFTYNDAVHKFIELYVVRKRNMSSRILGLSELYFPMFEEVMDAYQIPLEMKYLAIVESALNPNAVSRAGATGLWQFMYSTGKLYQLKVDSYMDLRRDPYLSTIAACEYFEHLYGMFHDWLLVLAAYNSGPGTVSRAIRRSGGEMDYWKLRTYLPSETRGYVPAFIAAAYFMNYASDHNIYPIRPKRMFYEIDTVMVRQPLELKQIALTLHIPLEDLEFLNPVYRLGKIPVVNQKPMKLTLPVEKIAAFINNEQAIYAYANPRDSLPDGTLVEYVTKEKKVYHTVRSGEYLGAIASQNHCSVGQIQAWNNLKSYMIHPGQKLVIYREVTEAVPVVTVDQAAAEESEEDQQKEVQKPHEESQYIMYVVQPGDTLHDIANKYAGISVSHLRELNGLNDSQEPPPGTKLKVSVKG
ncbi:MAG: LysM peptidoglycan-binding domain-containing protein [Flavobacteriales bacterium]|nr:LysM peptidoglycan-binding domain-containing protein [Flavobacteriales bacterium]